MSKCCSRCECRKEVGDFNKNKRSSDGYDAWCRDCHKQYNKEHHEVIARKKRELVERNREQVKKYMYDYTQKNKEPLKVKRREYVDNNREKINANTRKRQKEDIQFKLKETLRKKLLKLLGGVKSETATFYLGCSADELRVWLEFQFEPEMTWENHGSYWEIDHILPVSRFDMTKEFDKRVCFRWTNLQPLLKLENNLKNNKLALHYYFNSIVSIHRFIQNEHLDNSGYQAICESREWLKEKLRYGEKSVDDGGASSSS